MIAVSLILLTAGVYVPDPAGATSEPVIVADLGGRPIPAVDVGQYHCTDADFPRIHCYRTAAELEAAVAARSAAPTSPGSAAALTSGTNYVRIFADRDFQGASAYLSTAYDDLSVIGWNDRISSFQGLAGTGGTFFQHIYGGGFAYPFNAYQPVTYVGDAANDQFSSAKPR